FK
ncbi:Hypothetical protein EIN_337610, partial [Entamoeba invadens IP1]